MSQDEDWTGDKHRQQALTNKIMRACRGKDFVDVFGALQTIMANVIADNSPDLETTLEGLENNFEDMRRCARQIWEMRAAIEERLKSGGRMQ